MQRTLSTQVAGQLRTVHPQLPLLLATQAGPAIVLPSGQMKLIDFGIGPVHLSGVHDAGAAGGHCVNDGVCAILHEGCLCDDCKILPECAPWIPDAGLDGADGGG